MSRILHLVNMGLRYGRSKGVRDYRLEDGVLGNLAAPCHLEESASHHIYVLSFPNNIPKRQPIKIMKNHIFQKSSKLIQIHQKSFLCISNDS